MKKKIAYVLSIVSLMFALGACGTDPADVDYNGQSYDDLKTTITSMIEGVNTDYEYLNSAYEANGYDSLDDLLDYYEGSVDEYYLDAIRSYEEAIEVCGAYTSYDEDTFDIDKAGDTLSVSMTMNCEDRTSTVTVVYTYYNMEISAITFDPDYTTGEKLKSAGLNTLISMSVVFVVLILISLIISAFKLFSYFENKNKKEVVETKKPEDQVVAQIEKREEQQLTDDYELVAVIAAAIAASEGTSTDGFVVRSINRR